MSQQLKQSTDIPKVADGLSPSGNAAAGNAAQKARATLNDIVSSPAARVKLRDLPTRADKLNALADMIEQAAFAKENLGFNMKPYYFDGRSVSIRDQTGHACGTVACIAGWTAFDGDSAETKKGNPGDIHARAKAILGLSSDEANQLFGGYGSVYELQKITDKHAVAVLRDFAATGKIHWGHFNSEGKKSR